MERRRMFGEHPRMASREKMKISIITPTYNETETLPRFIESLMEALSEDHEYEVIIVDDNSPDGTGALAERLAEKYGCIKVIHRPGKLGLGTAYKEGFKHTSGDLIVSIDADLSHDPKDIPRLLEAVKEADIAIGSRLIKGGRIEGRSRWRDLMSITANGFIRLLAGQPIRDWTSGLRVYRREALEAILPKVACKKWDYQFEVLYKALKSKYRAREVPITFRERAGGRSKFDIKEALTFMKSIIQVYLNLK
ncbi:polyprenol monophosphomannose synthase [Candidatus Bathyarchaeota archaeon]|nr:polyprenol monophosphomannose synthase [Candidatus Bathyarchaeota archaeon]